MLMLSSRMRIFAATQPADFRRGIDGLLALVREDFGEDALTGDLFVFFNRRRDRVKMLQWDRNGFWLLQKRLECGVFEVLPTDGDRRLEIDRAKLTMLLEGIDTKKARFRRGFSADVRIQRRNETGKRAQAS